MYRKSSILFALFMALCQFISAETTGAPLEEQTETTAQNNLNDYRRSSLCIILVTHQGTKYAEDMERQFLKMQLPERYNEHNIQLRVLHTNKSLKSKNIAKLLENNEVGKQLIAKWFNRDPHTGQMNMDLIHERGGYNATMSDAERADMTVRGRALLQEEGVDLIQNTFVLVCDMQYKKRNDAGALASLGTFLLSAGMQAMGQYTHTDVSASTKQLNQAAGELADLSGFSVLMDAHLLQLKWTKDDLNKLYSNYWVDETTPTFEAEAHKKAFDNDANAFMLKYLGHYKNKSTKLEMEHSQGFDDLILTVTDKTVNKSIKELALMFPQFKPKTPLVHNKSGMVAYVGTKEDITNKSIFDVVESVKKNGEIKYKKVGSLKVVPGTVWDNTNIHLDKIENIQDVDGTHLYSKRNKTYSEQPYMLVEGNPHMKKFTFSAGIRLETMSYSEEKILEAILKKYKWYDGGVPTKKGMTFSWIDAGFTWNFSKVISWNVAEGYFGIGKFTNVGLCTGATVRFLQLDKRGNKSVYLQPMIGLGFLGTTGSSHQVEFPRNRYSKEKAFLDGYSYLDWRIKLGINLKNFYIAMGYGANKSLGFYAGYNLNFK